MFGLFQYSQWTTNMRSSLSYVTQYCVMRYLREIMFVMALELSHTSWLYPAIVAFRTTSIVPPLLFRRMVESLLKIFATIYLLHMRSIVNWLSKSMTSLRSSLILLFVACVCLKIFAMRGSNFSLNCVKCNPVWKWELLSWSKSDKSEPPSPSRASLVNWVLTVGKFFSSYWSLCSVFVRFWRCWGQTSRRRRCRTWPTSYFYPCNGWQVDLAFRICSTPYSSITFLLYESCCKNDAPSDTVFLGTAFLLYLSSRCRVSFRVLGYRLSPVLKTFCKSSLRFACWDPLFCKKT